MKKFFSFPTGRIKYSAKREELSYSYVKQLVIFFLLVVGIFPGLFGLIGIYNDSKKELISSKGLYFKEVAQSTALQIEKILDDKIEAIQRLTLLPSLKNMLILSPKSAQKDTHAFWKIVESEMVKKNIIFNIYGNSGEIVYSTKFSPGGVSYVPGTEDMSKSKEKMYISGVRQNPNFEDIFQIEVFAPVKDEYGNHIGTIQAIYVLDQLFSAITEVEIGSTGHANLVDSSGTILICPIYPIKSHQITFIESVSKHISFYTETSSIKFESIELSQLVTSSLSLLEYMFLSHKIEVNVENPNDPIILSGEPKLLNIVLMNIILNAIHAINGNGVISISMQQSGNWGILRVTDNGCGISNEEMDNVFDPFYSTKKGRKGFGLGLSISREIVEAHHGEISIVSTKGKGSKIEVKLKLAKNSELQPAKG